MLEVSFPIILLIYIDDDAENSGTVFRCVSGLGPNISSTNDVIGDLYFNDTLLTKGECHGFVEAVGAPQIYRRPGTINAHMCGNLTTSTEGVYTCILMNSSMMYESMKVGIYFSERCKSLYVY